MTVICGLLLKMCLCCFQTIEYSVALLIKSKEEGKYLFLFIMHINVLSYLISIWYHVQSHNIFIFFYFLIKQIFPFLLFDIIRLQDIIRFVHLRKKKKNRFSCCWLSPVFLIHVTDCCLGRFCSGTGSGSQCPVSPSQWGEGNVGGLALVSLLVSKPRAVHPVIWWQVE